MCVKSECGMRRKHLDATLHQHIYESKSVASLPATARTAHPLSVLAPVTCAFHLRRPFLPPANAPASHTPAPAKQDDVRPKPRQEMLECMCLGD